MGLQLDGLDALLSPKSIAVLGASADPSKIGGRPLTYLRANGFAGEIYPINPRHAQIQGMTAYASIQDVPDAIDLALVSVPGPAVVDSVRACADRGVRVATIFSAGFAETSPDGAGAQEEIAGISRDSGMRVLGPNCLGSANRRAGVSASFAASEGRPRPEGNLDGVALVSQSGAIAAYCVLAGLDRGISFDPWISTGNECDIQLADCLAHLALDDDVRVVAAYLEGCRDGDGLREALALAHERGKPVILLKSGRSTVGARAAASHTASMVGSAETYEALMRQYNVCVADSLDDLMDLSYGIGFGPVPSGSRTGLVTSSGGVGILMADVAESVALDVPPLPETAQLALREVWPSAGVENPIDTTAQLVNDQRLLAQFLVTALGQGGFDSMIVFLSYIGLIPSWSHAAVDALREARAAFPESQISLAMLTTPEVRASIESMGIRVFDDPTTAVRVMGRSVANRQGFQSPAAPPPTTVASSSTITGSGTLSEVDSAAVLSAAGVPVAPGVHVHSAEEAARAAADFGSAVVVKVVSQDLPHKSEAGGVRLDVTTPEAAARAYDEVTRAAARYAPDARLDGALVSPMLTGGLETILGVVSDPVFGPVVMFGLGGVYVEVLRDASYRLAPFTVTEATSMIQEIRGYGLLSGARGKPARDVASLATALSRLSVFADEHRHDLDSIDLNPFLVMPEGAGSVAVDALVVRRSMDETSRPSADD
ncbi:MAG TPA: acetate--CoA ligase family protein [Nocardioides sp.]|uniref:acetate--CoA ligase family protein n=1 Tax=Nocardioides sp. TaxID=35761 RepID=UPI002E302098|nr:acetate--CoA ligase family protein [Nocardioides sp.]HEX3929851.1 acetate--CoA ligase family protein [Nocardioides sp.]